jgi:L-aspartate oxidase
VTVSTSSMDIRWTDFLIFGTGVAGLRAAIELAPHGSVLIVNKGKPLESTTGLAQGGVAVALQEDDSWTSHLNDTLRAGKGLCRTESVEILVREGPRRIQELIDWGACFDQEKGHYLFAREGAHSHARILRAGGDATGAEILRILSAKVSAFPSVTCLDHHFSVDLLVDDGICLGAVLLRESGGPVMFVGCRGIVLATGGGGQAYSRTTNPAVATGDGMAVAYRAGARLADMEFVQFHPTAISLAGVPALLLTEAMRGEGARLRNKTGEAFMPRYHPDAELAPRDTVAMAIHQEMQCTVSDHVYLDITDHKADFLKQRFPTIYRTCMKYGLDITRDWIPVSPAAHFMIGGVETDINGATNLPGLYAAGEVAACGVHGANRLASNSLLEGLVIGASAAKALAVYKPHHADHRAILSRKAKDYVTAMASEKKHPTRSIDKDRNHLRELMWNNVGIVRKKASLTEALKILERWDAWQKAKPVSQKMGEFQNLLTISNLIAKAALLREESRGVHYRTDHPQSSSKWEQRHITFTIPD